MESRVAAKTVGSAVYIVGSRLGSNVDERADSPAVFRSGVLLGIEFLDGIDGQGARCSSSLVSVIHDLSAVHRVIGHDAIQQPHPVPGAKAIGRVAMVSSTWITHHSRAQLNQAREVAAI